MRKALVTFAVVGVVVVGPATAAFAEVSTTQQLPVAACNDGTMNAHSHIPAATGTGEMTPGHDAVPGTENVTPCGHGG